MSQFGAPAPQQEGPKYSLMAASALNTRKVRPMRAESGILPTAQSEC
ncbi:hypothetical protein ACPOL_0749 [Acidisarcina polymorpha]|uniref:Uncharacterized protein n=1 Tax=Acidisarcina polymorpha TaxID=2211140 RepID=A0A2Z5FTH7_9BACT|nr:hypothetical protein ACPOL_0749 [Acidisarcina polymorpha]